MKNRWFSVTFKNETLNIFASCTEEAYLKALDKLNIKYDRFNAYSVFRANKMEII